MREAGGISFRPVFRDRRARAALFVLMAGGVPAVVHGITVTGTPSAVEAQKSSISTAVTSQMILELPASRNVNDVLTLTLVPGNAATDPVPGVDRQTFLVDGVAKGATFPPGTTVTFGDVREWEIGPSYTFRLRDPNDPFSITVRRPGVKKPIVEQKVHLPLEHGWERPMYGFPPPATGKYETPPVAVAGRTHVIRGALSGDGTRTKVWIGGRPARIVAENPRSVFFEIPGDTPAGMTKIVLEDDGGRTELPIAVLQMAMSADRLTLHKGESTTFHVTISGPESWTDDAWKGGAPSDLCDVDALGKKFPGFKPPAPGGDGFLMFSITNLSPSVISITEFARPLGKSAFAKGVYSYDGQIRSIRDGSFGIHGEVQAFVAPVTAGATSLPPPDAKK